QRQRKDKHHRAEPACRQVSRQEWQGHEPVERKPGNDGKPPCKRWPNNDLSGICSAIHGGIVTLQTIVKLLPNPNLDLAFRARMSASAGCGHSVARAYVRKPAQ